MSFLSFNLNTKLKWKKYCEKFENFDFYFTPEYHHLYQSRYRHSKPFAWTYNKGNNFFLYAFNLTSVPNIKWKNKKIYDISSTYGFVGPISTTKDKKFLSEAWKEFDVWAKEKNIILEFIRFNPIIENQVYKHNNSKIEFNRYIAVSDFTKGVDIFKSQIQSKTRNMIRKAIKNNFETKEVKLSDFKKEFYNIYKSTMKRNKAKNFFYYDLKYFNFLCDLKETKFFGVFLNNKLIGGGIFFVNNASAIYHLGACKKEFLKFGVSNLYLYDASINFCKQKIKYLNLGGGRTTDKNDTLLKFKRDNSTELRKFFIGKRIINKKIYDYICKKFSGDKIKNNNLIFYRD